MVHMTKTTTNHTWKGDAFFQNTFPNFNEKLLKQSKLKNFNMKVDKNVDFRQMDNINP